MPYTNSFQGWFPIQPDKAMHFYDIIDPIQDKPQLIQIDNEFEARMQFWEETAPPTCKHLMQSENNKNVEL